MRSTITKFVNTFRVANPIYRAGMVTGLAACVAGTAALCTIGARMGTDIVRTIFAWYL